MRVHQHHGGFYIQVVAKITLFDAFAQTATKMVEHHLPHRTLVAGFDVGIVFAQIVKEIVKQVVSVVRAGFAYLVHGNVDGVARTVGDCHLRLALLAHAAQQRFYQLLFRTKVHVESLFRNVDTIADVVDGDAAQTASHKHFACCFQYLVLCVHSKSYFFSHAVF